MPSELTESVLEREGCPLHYWVGGAVGRPPIVFTHGACVDHHSFDRQIPLVAAREPNCTYAVIPDAQHFSMMDNADTFNRLLLDFLAQYAE